MKTNQTPEQHRRQMDRLHDADADATLFPPTDTNTDFFGTSIIRLRYQQQQHSANIVELLPEEALKIVSVLSEALASWAAFEVEQKREAYLTERFHEQVNAQAK